MARLLSHTTTTLQNEDEAYPPVNEFVFAAELEDDEHPATEGLAGYETSGPFLNLGYKGAWGQGGGGHWM